MSVIGLRVGPFEISSPATVPEPGSWYVARRVGITRRQPHEVLVCLLPPDADAGARAQLQKRYEVLRSLDDPRLPSPVALYEGTGALALSATQGVALSELVARRRSGELAMSPSTLLDVALELSEAIQHSHHRGQQHGHLQPDSIWIGADGGLCIWGYGSETDVPEPWRAPDSSRGPHTDQWSLGALLAGLVSGHPPWRGEDPAEQRRRGDAADAVSLIEAQWPALGRLLRRMMSRNPDNRFPNLHPVRQELLALARKAAGTSDRRAIGALLAKEARNAALLAPAEPDTTVTAMKGPAPIAPTQPESESESDSDPDSAEESTEYDIAPRPPTDEEPPPPSEEEVTVAVARLQDRQGDPAARTRGPLPDEAIVVVRPDLPEEPDGPPAAPAEPDEPEPTEAEPPTEHIDEVVHDSASTEVEGSFAMHEAAVMPEDTSASEMVPDPTDLGVDAVGSPPPIRLEPQAPPAPEPPKQVEVEVEFSDESVVPGAGDGGGDGGAIAYDAGALPISTAPEESPTLDFGNTEIRGSDEETEPLPSKHGNQAPHEDAAGPLVPVPGPGTEDPEDDGPSLVLPEEEDIAPPLAPAKPPPITRVAIVLVAVMLGLMLLWFILWA